MGKARYYMAGIGILTLLGYTILFTVDETQYAIVTTFGKPVKTITEPGLYWKLPAPAQTVLRFDKRLQIFDPRPTENFTRDRKNLVVDSYACWRVVDPNRFLEKTQTIEGAESSLSVLVASQLSAELGKHELSAIVSVKEGEVKLDEIMDSVTQRCRDTALADYGIEVLDVRIKRVNLPDENKQSVYRRMRAEREQKAKEYRAQAEEQAMIIRADTDKQQREILSAAYKDAQGIKGEGEAEAIRVYAAAYNRDPKFYRFMRTLAAYKKILTENTTLVLSSESEFLKILSDFDPAAFSNEAENDAEGEPEQ
ncbi:MAG TPA: protease modulator HflC [Candidatus Hydrogenedentes bacterium]|nr:protease modulator HflC [Candidatus Hydrogenedentota bacterium]